MTEISSPDPGKIGQNLKNAASGISKSGISREGINSDQDKLLIRMVETGNMMADYKRALLKGKYIPQPDGKGVHLLGIPTVTDTASGI